MWIRDTRCYTGRLPPAPVRVGLVNEAQLRHGLNELGKTGSDPAGDKTDHTLAVLATITDPIYQSSLDSDSEGGGEVYMVGNGEEFPNKMVEEIQREAKEEITRVKCLARETERRKRHNGL
jgi:hypothetical protein